MTPGEEVPTRLLSATSAEVSARRQELRRLGTATRLLIDRLVGTDAAEEDLARAADAIEAIAHSFRAEAPRSMYDGFAEMSIAGGEGGAAAFFDHSPFIGLANPLSPPLRLSLHEDHVEAAVTFGSAYEGPPGCVHGGYVAAAFDEVLGAAQTFSGAPGMTGTLTVRYRRPTPLHAPLRVDGRFLRREGRKVFTEGRMWAGDVLTAEAEAIFVSIPTERFRTLLRDREEQAPEGRGARPVAEGT